MLGRRLWLKTAMVSILSLLPGRRTRGQEGVGINFAENLTNRNITPLEDQLRYGLRVVLPEQLQFVKVVVAYVDQGKLPRAMVNLVYKWALERNPSVPFPYFQYALRLLAKRRGVTLPLRLP
jgi:hypothetical protein